MIVHNYGVTFSSVSNVSLRLGPDMKHANQPMSYLESTICLLYMYKMYNNALSQEFKNFEWVQSR